jgi:hypothetical protein
VATRAGGWKAPFRTGAVASRHSAASVRRVPASAFGHPTTYRCSFFGGLGLFSGCMHATVPRRFWMGLDGFAEGDLRKTGDY